MNIYGIKPHAAHCTVSERDSFIDRQLDAIYSCVLACTPKRQLFLNHISFIIYGESAVNESRKLAYLFKSGMYVVRCGPRQSY